MVRLGCLCDGCVKRLGVDERLLMPLNYADVNQLPEYDPKKMTGIQFPASSQAFGLTKGSQGTTKITYKVAKTVKEMIDEHGSQPSQSSRMGSNHGSSKKS